MQFPCFVSAVVAWALSARISAGASSGEVAFVRDLAVTML